MEIFPTQESGKRQFFKRGFLELRANEQVEVTWTRGSGSASGHWNGENKQCTALALSHSNVLEGISVNFQNPW